MGGGLGSGGSTPRESFPRCGPLCPNATVLGMYRKELKAVGCEASRTRGPAHTTWHTSAAPATSGRLALCPGMLPGLGASGALPPGMSALRRIQVGARQVPRQGCSRPAALTADSLSPEAALARGCAPGSAQGLGPHSRGGAASQGLPTSAGGRGAPDSLRPGSPPSWASCFELLAICRRRCAGLDAPGNKATKNSSQLTSTYFQKRK